MKTSIPRNIFLLSGILISLISVSILPYTAYAIILIPILLLFYFFGESFFITSSITLLIVFTRIEFSNARDLVTLLIISSSLLLFFKKYAFEFNKYPKVPKESLAVVLLLTFVVILSILMNGLVSTSFMSLARTIVFFLFCYTLYAFIRGEKEIRILIYSLFISQAIIGISILYDFYKLGFNFFYENGVLARFTGIIDNPNFIGLLTTISTNFVLALFFSEKSKSRKFKLMLILILINNFIIMLFTDSRAAVISIIIGGAIILLTFNKKAFLKSVLYGSVSLLLLLLIPTVQDYVMVLLRPQEFSAREHLWNSGLEMFYQHPLFGVGPEKFPDHFFTYLSSSALELFTDTGQFTIGKVPSPHNFFLLMGAENGIPGLIAGVSLFVCFLYMSWKLVSLKRIVEHEDYIIVISLLASGLGTLFRAFFEISGVFYYGYMSRDLSFWITIILLSYLFQKYKIKSLAII